jgi:YidC/Oxa1 family membrane protein insertase
VNIFDLIVIQPIFNLLIGLYSLIPGGDFGIAVIIFTILVRLALWPLVKKQFHQVKAMQKMQPELVKIKKAAKGNKQLESMQMMELYKEHDVNPFRSIGILLIQLPIFIALYQVIQIFTLHRDQVDKFTYGFMKGLGPVKELIAHPNSLNEKLFGIIDLTKQAISSNPLSVNIFLLVLAIIAAITQYIMSKQTSPTQQSNKSLKEIMSEATDGKQTDQSEMNAVMMGKMVKFMPIMMFFIMIYLPGALVLYYTVSNLAAVLQQHSILNKDTEEMIDIADKADISQNKKATAKARLKQAQTAQITRIVAKDTVGNKKEKL